MRKDVRLGLAVGGILFGAVLVYVVFFSNSGNKPSGANNRTDSGNTPLATGTGSATGANTAAGGNSTTSAQASGTQLPALPGLPADTTTGAAAMGATSTAGRTGSVSFGGPADTAVGTGAGTAAVATGTGAVATGAAANTSGEGATAGMPKRSWSDLLENGGVASRNPVVASNTTTETTTPPVAGASTLIDPGTTIVPARPSGTSRNYIVKPKETYWSIAAVEYGNGAYANALIKANPKVTPNRLRAGTTIVIPDKSDVVPTHLTKADSAGPTTRPIDPNLQYIVLPGDNLYTICKRKYGSTDKVDVLYKLNKDLIGPNPAALKPKMVLQLPEPPTVSATINSATSNTQPDLIMGGR